MKTVEEEQAAIRALAQRSEVCRAPNAPADLRAHGYAEAAAEAEKYAVYDVRPMRMVCALYRGSSLMIGNRTGHCRDCGEPIQWRPDAPEYLVKTCACCALERRP